MPVTIDGTSGITTPTYNGADTSEYIVPVTAFKNRIINGAMMIDQRNAGASVTAGGYTLDRWALDVSAASKLSIQQNAGSVTPPSGFKNYLGATSTSAYSIGASEIFLISQPIEGLNIYDLGWGAVGASSVTLSFWVRSSLTGTFGGMIENSSANRNYVFSYTISSANTWEYKTITIAGDTSGTWLTTNGVGLILRFAMAAGTSTQTTAGSWGATRYFAPTGQTSLVGTNGATFYLTGVQLEKGSTATSFDYRPYGTELQLCERYAQYVETSANGQFSSGTMNVPVPYRVTMRSAPSSTAISVRVSGGVSSYTLNSPTVYGAEFQITANATNPYVLGARYLLTSEL